MIGSVKKQLKTLQARLENVWANSLCWGSGRVKKELMARISELPSQGEVPEKQRSRYQWLAEGDPNTYIFPGQRRRRDCALVKLNR